MAAITFSHRDFSGGVPVDACWTVERLRWRALGGCWDGRLRAEGSPAALWNLTHLLRCGAQVQGDHGAAWWGCVHAVTVVIDGVGCTVTLDGLANRVRAVYRRRNPAGTLEEAWTGWHEHAASAAQWGRFERVITLDEASDAEAEAAAAAALAGAHQPRVQARSGGQAACAILELRGWWRSLAWEQYAEPRGAQGYPAAVDTTIRLGETPAVTALAQSWTAAGTWRLKEAWLRVARTLAADGLKLEVVERSSSTLLAETTLPAAQIGESLGWARFVLPGAGVPLQAEAQYWLRLWRTGAPGSGGYYRAGLDDGQSFGGDLWVHDGSSWAPRGAPGDLPFWLVGVEDTRAQAAAMARGQFVRGVLVDSPSGPDGILYRDGRRTRQQEAEALLAAANLCADVDAGRGVTIRAKPSTPRWRLGAGGALLQPDGSPAGLAANPAGEWAAAPQGAQVWLEWVTWDGEKLRAGA